MIPGIDLAGEVVASEDERFKVGSEVLVTGFQTGMTHTGGYSEYARIPGDWIVNIPKGLNAKDVMTIGTAGFTAAISIIALENAGMCVENQPEILVTGASGGVGSVATQMLLKSGYKNVSVLSKDKSSEGEFLKNWESKRYMIWKIYLQNQKKQTSRETEIPLHIGYSRGSYSFKIAS